MVTDLEWAYCEKKYRCVNYTENLMSRRFMSDKIKQHKEVISNFEIKREIIKKFLEQDNVVGCVLEKRIQNKK